MINTAGGKHTLFAVLLTCVWGASLSVAAQADPTLLAERGQRWLASQQSSGGSWSADERYPTAMTALSGIALLTGGSTPNGGPYAANLRRAVDYLTAQSQPSGLIGDPLRDDRYTYGHGFSMLLLSQMLGEEEDQERRAELIRVLEGAVRFTARAQTAAGGWGYVSSREDGSGFDEGSTTITQVQGLRGCRNAGIPVPKRVIDRAVEYIHNCTMEDGGVQYSSNGGGGRPAITAAAIACLYNAGEYDDRFVPRMRDYCGKHLGMQNETSYGHWHYAHFYYSQVKYREAGKAWRAYQAATLEKLAREAEEVETPLGPGVVWRQGYIGPVYTTALNLVILQLDHGYLPIYQR